MTFFIFYLLVILSAPGFVISVEQLVGKTFLANIKPFSCPFCLSFWYGVLWGCYGVLIFKFSFLDVSFLPFITGSFSYAFLISLDK